MDSCLFVSLAEQVLLVRVFKKNKIFRKFAVAFLSFV